MSQGNLPDVFLDTDVSFDIISKRKPHFSASVALLEMTANGVVRPLISESSLATLFYLAFDIYKLRDASKKLSDFIGACEVVNAGKDTVLRALQSSYRDREDALQYFTALKAGADYFITRNTKDYRAAVDTLPVYTPQEFSKLVS
ncbi:MAG TPA: PIN domain-containing protein [Cyclobacteriaceae bacterium]|jgi:predicted nucleic acid-binding protein